jgi:hypothetical protein
LFHSPANKRYLLLLVLKKHRRLCLGNQITFGYASAYKLFFASFTFVTRGISTAAAPAAAALVSVVQIVSGSYALRAIAAVPLALRTLQFSSDLTCVAIRFCEFRHKPPLSVCGKLLYFFPESGSIATH